jgi:hypothetical protein
MGADGFVCWTARVIEDPTELRETVGTLLPDAEALDETRRSGLLEGTTPTPRGLAAADAFSERSGLPMPGPDAAIADFRTLLETVDAAAEAGRRLSDSDVPDGFEPIRPSVDRYDREYYTVNRARQYPSGAEVELNYRSRDPSHVREPKPNVSSLALWLRGDAAGTHEYRTEWRER